MGFDRTTGSSSRVEFRERLDRILELAVQESSFDGVYFGPWWELSGPGFVDGWKRAVLRRRPGGGADHWGHLFLVFSAAQASVRISTEADPRITSPRLGPVRRVGWIAPGYALLVRPSHPEGSFELDRLADLTFSKLASDPKPDQD